jgi:hypothetical protein
MKLGKKRRESSKRKYHIISQRVIIKAIVISEKVGLFPSAKIWAQVGTVLPKLRKQYREPDFKKASPASLLRVPSEHETCTACSLHSSRGAYVV